MKVSKNNLKNELDTYTELYWWNFRKKTLSYKGDLRGLLKEMNISYTKKKTKMDGIFEYRFKSEYGITFKTTGTINDFRHKAKQFIQMELVRMGDKSTLFVQGTWRPIVTVNH